MNRTKRRRAVIARYERYLAASTVDEDLRGKSVRGAAATGGGQMLRFVIMTGSTMILARLLTPDDWGLVTKVTAITNFIMLFRNLGLGQAVVQRAHISHAGVSTLFWIGVLSSLVLAGVTCLLAPLLGNFYGSPEVVGITLALAIGIVAGGLVPQHVALLERRMEFKTLVKLDITATFCAVAVGVLAALLGLGYWALVILQIAMGLFYFVAIWTVCPWRPSLPTWSREVREMLGFGLNLSGFNILNYFSRNADNVLIGKVWGDAQLGLYSRAYQLLLLPINQINAPMGAVVIPALSRLQDDPERYRRYYRRAMEVVTMLGMPIVVFSFLAADHLVRLFLGEQWMAAVPIFRCLAPAAFIGTMNVSAGWIFVSRGKTAQMLFIGGWINMPIILIAFFLGLSGGALGVAIAYSIVTALLLIPTNYFAFTQTPIRLRDLFGSVWRGAAASLLAGSCTYYLANWLDLTWPFLALVTLALIYGTVYLFAAVVLPGGRHAILQIYNLASEMKSFRNLINKARRLVQ